MQFYRVWKDDSNVEHRARLSFFLDDVTEWEEYIYDGVFSKNKSPKMYVTLNHERTYIIECSYDKFNEIMTGFLNGKDLDNLYMCLN